MEKTQQNQWIIGNLQLTSPQVFDSGKQNLIIYGRIDSLANITFKGKNIVFIGTANSLGILTMHATNDIFVAGIFKGHVFTDVNAGNDINGSLDDLAIQKINALGVKIARDPIGKVAITLPNFSALPVLENMRS